ncbi:sensor histidine kinase [Flavobacterium silvaticum]|uniref:Histidine kinase n=1 Tax=Flavobacterium silvaticum TaxID=1852020 RepID=A0A972FV19_9FLAO|nr:histidine kinase [Flavobacterium silvaticum]NMH28582.1 histidine kinase [Flavobacterium silvaticum]
MDSQFIYIVLIVVLAVVSFWTILLWRKSETKRRETDSRFRELENRLNDLQLENLESRLNPHLFKNILNSIQSHAYQTYFALDKMANVLDYILYESRKKFVSPHEEINFALNLIEINKIKVSPLFDLRVKTDINETDVLYDQPLLAPMVSIDLIENAFKHADLQSAGSFISVAIEFRSGRFSVIVSNKISNRKALQKENGGLGKEALEKRLQILHGDAFELRHFVENDIFTAHLKIDLREKA